MLNFVLAAALALILNDDADTPRGPFLQFTCADAAWSARIDPIGDTNHDHIGVGRSEATVRPETTSASLKADANTASNCATHGGVTDPHAYWFPKVREGGEPMEFAISRVYYSDRWLSPSGDLKRQFPAGMEAIGGGDYGPVEFRCMEGPRVRTVPIGCRPPGHDGREGHPGTVRFIAHFPNCWDGSDTGPRDFVFRYPDRGCPSNFVRVPDRRVTADFIPADGRLDSPVRVSAGMGDDGVMSAPASSFHADAMDGDPLADGMGGTTLGFESLLRRCVLAPDSSTTEPARPECFPHLSGEETA